MHVYSLSPIDYPINLNPSSRVTCPPINLSPREPFLNLPHDVLADDPQKVVKVIASNGKSGDQCELSYTNCKVVGNGSFGVVFQAKLVNGSLNDDGGDDDVAIKKVLQDKRFKVRWQFTSDSNRARPTTTGCSQRRSARARWRRFSEAFRRGRRNDWS